jgi:hypothetical protein
MRICTICGKSWERKVAKAKFVSVPLGTFNIKYIVCKPCYLQMLEGAR